MASASGISKFTKSLIRNRLQVHKLCKIKRTTDNTIKNQIMKWIPGKYSSVLVEKLQLLKSSDRQTLYCNNLTSPLSIKISNKQFKEELKNNIENVDNNIFMNPVQTLSKVQKKLKAPAIISQIELTLSDYNKVKPICPPNSPSKNAPFTCPPCPLKCPPYPKISKSQSNQDPCKPKNDPCQPKKDPCKLKQDLCKPNKDPCKTSKNSCQPTLDPCKPKKDPCQPSKNPCKPKRNPSKPKKNPCQPKQNPCKPKKDPCQPRKCSSSIETSLCAPYFTKRQTISQNIKC